MFSTRIIPVVNLSFIVGLRQRSVNSLKRILLSLNTKRNILRRLERNHRKIKYLEMYSKIFIHIGRKLKQMLPLTLLVGIFAWNSGIDGYRIGPFNKTAVEDRSGGFPKFPQSFLINSGDNHFIHGFYLSHKTPEPLPLNHRNTCGTRSVAFNPKRSGKIIGGKLRSGFDFQFYVIAIIY